MHTEKTYEGTVKVTTDIYRFEVLRTAEGGSVEFGLIENIYINGVRAGVGELRKYNARFDQLPATFPVTVNGNVVQVAGQTILDALDAVAAAIMALPQD